MFTRTKSNRSRERGRYSLKEFSYLLSPVCILRWNVARPCTPPRTETSPNVADLKRADVSGLERWADDSRRSPRTSSRKRLNSRRLSIPAHGERGGRVSCLAGACAVGMANVSGQTMTITPVSLLVVDDDESL